MNVSKRVSGEAELLDEPGPDRRIGAGDLILQQGEGLRVGVGEKIDPRAHELADLDQQSLEGKGRLLHPEGVFAMQRLFPLHRLHSRDVEEPSL